MEQWNMAEKSERISTSVTPETRERIEARLEYGDEMSAWIREAIFEKLEKDEDTEGNPHAATSTAD